MVICRFRRPVSTDLYMPDGGVLHVSVMEEYLSLSYGLKCKQIICYNLLVAGVYIVSITLFHPLSLTDLDSLNNSIALGHAQTGDPILFLPIGTPLIGFLYEQFFGELRYKRCSSFRSAVSRLGMRGGFGYHWYSSIKCHSCSI